MAAGKEADAELLDDVVLANDDAAQFSGESTVSGAQFVDGGDVVCGEGGAGKGWGCVRHGWEGRGEGMTPETELGCKRKGSVAT